MTTVSVTTSRVAGTLPAKGNCAQVISVAPSFTVNNVDPAIRVY